MTEASIVGTVIGDRWRVTELIGRGGFGQVFACHDESDIAIGDAAVKLLHANTTPLERSEFLREVKQMAQLRHQNLVGYLDSGLHAIGDDVHPFLVTERCDRSLGDRLAAAADHRGLDPGGEAPARPLDGPEATAVLSDVLDGLVHLHERQLVHRDLKPANVLWGDGAWKLADFGLMREVTATGSYHRGDQIVGTPRFMAPELFTTGRATAAGDVYAIGVLAHLLVTGRTVHGGSGLALVNAVTSSPPELDRRISGPWAAWIAGALVTEPERRPTARQLRDQLGRLGDVPALTAAPPRPMSATTLVTDRPSAWPPPAGGPAATRPAEPDRYGPGPTGSGPTPTDPTATRTVDRPVAAPTGPSGPTGAAGAGPWAAPPSTPVADGPPAAGPPLDPGAAAPPAGPSPARAPSSPSGPPARLLAAVAAAVAVPLLAVGWFVLTRGDDEPAAIDQAVSAGNDGEAVTDGDVSGGGDGDGDGGVRIGDGVEIGDGVDVDSGGDPSGGSGGTADRAGPVSPAEAHVAALPCATGVTEQVVLTNPDAGHRDYRIHVHHLDADGVRIGEQLALVKGVAPGAVVSAGVPPLEDGVVACEIETFLVTATDPASIAAIDDAELTDCTLDGGWHAVAVDVTNTGDRRVDAEVYVAVVDGDGVRVDEDWAGMSAYGIGPGETVRVEESHVFWNLDAVGNPEVTCEIVAVELE